MRKQIIAMGGGGFSMEPGNLALDQYVVAQAVRPRPAVCFLGTASGDAESYLLGFYRAFSRLDCRPSHLPLFARTPHLRDVLLKQDVIYVGGGNTRTLLGVWREWGLPEILREALEAGVVLAGISAGALCWFEWGLTDASADGYRPLRALGFLPGGCCPHFDGDPGRKPALHAFVESGELGPTLGLDDGAAAHYVDGELLRMVCSRPGIGGHLVAQSLGVVKERDIPGEYLDPVPGCPG